MLLAYVDRIRRDQTAEYARQCLLYTIRPGKQRPRPGRFVRVKR